MSRNILREVLSRVNHNPVMLAPGQEQSFVQNLQELRAHTTLTAAQEQEMQDKRISEVASMYGYSYSREVNEKPYAYNNGVAIIPAHGSLINRFNWSYGYVTGYNFITRMAEMAADDDDVEMIVLDVDTYGGEVHGCFEAAGKLREIDARKPVVAVVDSVCCSAGYAIASAARKIYVTPGGNVGSIGVISMHVSIERALEMEGVKVTLITSGEHKADGNQYKDLSAEVLAKIKANVDKRREEFVELVAKHRNISADAVRDTEAEVYRPDEALDLGLIDAISVPGDAVEAYKSDSAVDEDDTSDDHEDDEEDHMKKTPEQIAADKAARTEERARIAGITQHAEAKGRTKLAAHLAFKTSMSVEEAVEMLAEAEKEVTSTPAPKTTTRSKAQASSTDTDDGDDEGDDEGDDADDEGDDADADDGKGKGETKTSAKSKSMRDAARSGFKKAMANSDHPNLGADRKKGEDGDEDGDNRKKVSRAAAAMSAIGFKGADKSKAH